MKTLIRDSKTGKPLTYENGKSHKLVDGKSFEMVPAVTVNEEQKLFVIPCSSGHSCLGFDVLESRAVKLGSELVNQFGYSVNQPEPRGTLARYYQYQSYVEYARTRNAESGWRSKSELMPQLIGLEGRRLEIVLADGTKARFTVGRSTGFIPCHLAMASANCNGGGAVCLTSEIKSVRVLK